VNNAGRAVRKPAVELEKEEWDAVIELNLEVEDIASAILFLCRPAARCITGVTLPVDSGYLAR